ncbi:hypothetical protein ACFVW2_14215 [Streptomyces sp. NPDC058171]
MELHEIIHDWCDAAVRTNRALRQIGTAAEGQWETTYSGGGNGAGRPYTFLSLKLGRSYVERAHREINSIMEPAAPLTQRWSPNKRRQAARRSLRGLMTIYCAELLLSFEQAVQARTDWVGKYREFIDESLKEGHVSRSRLRSLSAETEETTAALVVARNELKAFIKERYPVGHEDLAPADDPRRG